MPPRPIGFGVPGEGIFHPQSEAPGVLHVLSNHPQASQGVLFDLGGTAASQAVKFDITAPFTFAAQVVSFDILGHQAASQLVKFDLGTKGSVAHQAVNFDLLNEQDGQPITTGVYVTVV